jgi:hypothetical protein
MKQSAILLIVLLHTLPKIRAFTPNVNAYLIPHMPSTKLTFKDVPSVPKLRIADPITIAPGDTLQGVSSHPNSIHFHDASGNEIIVTGPNVTAIALSWADVIKFGRKVIGLLSEGGGGAGGGKCTTTQVQTFDSAGHLTGQTTTTTCTTGPA